MLDNIEYSKEWLTKKILETHFNNLKENKDLIVKIRYEDLLKLILKFIKLNERNYNDET